MSRTSSLREQLQNVPQPPIYVPARLISIHLTACLHSLRFSPDLVTVLWILTLFLASILFSFGTTISNVIGGIFIIWYYILDCVDGELARLSGTSSKIGSQLEQVGHWVTQGTLIIGITHGISSESHVSIWLIGSAALLGDYTFHFTYFTINVAFDRKLNYGFLHALTRWLYKLMPINTNLFILGSFVNEMFFVLSLWAILSNILWLIVFGQYYRVEKRQAISKPGQGVGP
jgi:phosphatidylglycerophosphate synthase